mgnify:CR=1 FL=1|jgi:CheY-like chemotaxis protein
MILIIDDNKVLADIFGEYLNLLGYEVTTTYNGEEGLAKAKELRPEVILCDIGMEGMNGYEIAEFIRQDTEIKDTSMIAISGYSNQKSMERALKAGFNKYLNKPIDFDYLIKLLDNLG